MDYAKLNIDAARSSLESVQKMHALGLVTDADLTIAQNLARQSVSEVMGEVIKERQMAAAGVMLRQRSGGMRVRRAARMQAIGAAVAGRDSVRGQIRATRTERTESSVDTMLQAMTFA